MGCCEGLLKENDILSNTPVIMNELESVTGTCQRCSFVYNPYTTDPLSITHDEKPSHSPISHVPTIELPDNLSEISILSWKNIGP